MYSAMCLEAAAYDMNAIIYGDKIAKNKDAETKTKDRWKILIRSLSDKEINPNSKPYDFINKLNNARDGLAHHKSTKVDINADNIHELITNESKEIDDFKRSVKHSFMAIIYMSLEINFVFGGNIKILPDFRNPLFGERSDKLNNLINKCIKDYN